MGAFLKQFCTKEIFLPYWFLYDYLGILLIAGMLVHNTEDRYNTADFKIYFFLAAAVRIVCNCAFFHFSFGSVGAFLKQFCTKEIFLPYWFLYEYLGILLILPFLKKIVQNLTQQEKQLLFGLILGWNRASDMAP